MTPRLAACLVLCMALSSLACCSPLPGKAPAADSQQYPDVPGLQEVVPLPEYELELALDAAGLRLTGREAVTYPNRTGGELDEIVFRLYPNLPQYGARLEVGPVWVDGQRGSSSLRAEDSALVVPLPQPLKPDASVTISMTFDVAIPQRPEGYVLFGYSQGVWSLPDAYPLLAAHTGSAGPATADSSRSETGWYEDIAPAYGDAVFAEVALYSATLVVPGNLTVVANGSVVSDTLTADGQRVVRTSAGPLREFAWLAGADYQAVEMDVQGVRVRSYYLPGDESAAQAALSTAGAALRTYAQAFGPYPFSELAVAEAPLEYYGMEYPGLNLIGVGLYREHRSELEDRVAHEIAHQWWYAQVGSDQVNTPWLDEGLAEHSTAIYYQQVYGQARANTFINQRWLVPYQVAVEDGHDAVVNQSAAAFGPEYEVIVYAKSALFFESLRSLVGDDVYRAILQEYVKRYRWRVATPEDFVQVAESVSGEDLDALYGRWILSKN